jgi:ribosome maturation factor RimP
LHQQKTVEGNEERSLLLFLPMNEEQQIQALQHKIGNLISAEPWVFLVEVKIRPTNNIKVFLDGDQGISIDKLVQYNRNLYKQIEESNMFPNGDFSLEVSSPGLDEPLKLHRQYLKNIGRYVEVTEKDGNKKEGKLLSATEAEIIIEEERGKKKRKNCYNTIFPLKILNQLKFKLNFEIISSFCNKQFM